MEPAPAVLNSILARYDLAGARALPADAGLINATYLVTAPSGNRYVLQRVNPIFPAGIHSDIETVTAHLERKHLLTPRLVRTSAGELYAQENGETWRLLTHIDGETRHMVNNANAAGEAGRLLARFHLALVDLDYDFPHARAGVHDTPRHLQRLRVCLAERTDHPRFADIEPLGRAILEAAGRLPPLPPLAWRIVHGDPKISNILFARDSDRALCLIDLDTLARMPLPLELGDAFRSWCNTAGEDTRHGEFSAGLFQAAVDGYAEHAAAMITNAESGSILPGTLTICVELAARFCTDALREDYFEWDARRFSSHSEHSEVRAAGQLAVAVALQRQWAALDRTVARAFGI